MTPAAIRLVCRRCRKQMHTLAWSETEHRLQLLGPGLRQRWSAAAWWDHRGEEVRGLRYDCRRHRKGSSFAGVVAMEDLAGAYKSAIDRGDREIALPL